MNSRIAAALVLLPAAVLAANGPMDWAPVSTNAIAAWSKDRSAPSFLLTDKAAGKVVFLAEATGLGVGDTAEFVVCGPLSDRAYESMFMSLAKPEDITAAVESLGVPRGVPGLGQPDHGVLHQIGIRLIRGEDLVDLLQHAGVDVAGALAEIGRHLALDLGAVDQMALA